MAKSGATLSKMKCCGGPSLTLHDLKALGRSEDKPVASNKKLLVVTYDDLVEDTEAQLRRVLGFLLPREKPESLDLACVMERNEGIL